MSIMDTFRSTFGGGAATSEAAAQDAPAAPATGQQGQQAPAGNTGAAPAGETGAEQETTGNGENVSPLDSFSDLWETAKDAEGNEIASSENFDPSKMFNIDPAKMQEAVSQMDFSQAIPAETFQQIQEGGEGAQQAFANAMNLVARQAFSQSMMGSAKLVEQAMSKANQSLDSRIDARTRQSQVSSTVRDSNPAFKHPAAAPMISMLEQQFTAKHPNASPQEISQMATDYFAKFADSMAGGNGGKGNGSNDKGDGGLDWDSWLQS